MDKVGEQLYKEVNYVIKSENEGQYLVLPLKSDRLKLLDNTLAIFLTFSEYVNGSDNLPLYKIPKKVTQLVQQVLTISGESLWT